MVPASVTTGAEVTAMDIQEEPFKGTLVALSLSLLGDFLFPFFFNYSEGLVSL